MLRVVAMDASADERRFVEASLLTRPPDERDVENWLCEAGKMVVGRAGETPLVGFLKVKTAAEEAALARHVYGGELGPVVRCADGSPAHWGGVHSSEQGV